MTLLALDLSTKNTGWALYKGKKLVNYGYISPKVPGLYKMKYPISGLYKILSVSYDVRELILEKNPDIILFEEVNKGKNRISQKSLDALHYFILEEIRQHAEEMLKNVKYIDSGGRKGWRPILGLALTDEDKEYNKELRTTYKGQKRVIERLKRGWKDISTRYVNGLYGLNLDHREREYDGDIADAICVAEGYLKSKR